MAKIKFETAKLYDLDRNIFDIHDGCYTEDGKYLGDTDPKFGLTKYYPAPTQSELKKWLRETHKIYVTSLPSYADKSDNKVHFFEIFYRNKCSQMGDRYGYFEKFEEALEIGFFEAHKLIKKK